MAYKYAKIHVDHSSDGFSSLSVQLY